MREQARIKEARRRLKRLHRASKSWRTVAAMVGTSVGPLYRFAVQGTLPKSARLVEALLSVVPEEAKAMNAEQARIVHLLQTYHLGKERAVKMRERGPGGQESGLLVELYGLGAALDVSKNNKIERALREELVTINEAHGGIICSNAAAGYWWAATLEEVQECVGELEHRGKIILVHASHLMRNAAEHFGQQLTLLEVGHD